MSAALNAGGIEDGENMWNLNVLLVLLFLSNNAYADVIPAKISSDDLPPNLKGSIPAKEIPEIRKRVNHYIKNLKKRRDAGYVPDMNMGLDEYAAYTQWGLNEKSIIPDKGFVGECIPKTDENQIICYLFWPQKFKKISDISQHYKNYTEEVTANYSTSMSKRGATQSFTFVSFLNIGDRFVPVLELVHDKRAGETKKTTNKNILNGPVK